ncbi:MAG: hypothetical protein D6766_12315 [Verrucomicrobia bacterium]|nr:MAG: hypothetical protein D6766_12315 [Verrucomicrobiota bacterium]
MKTVRLLLLLLFAALAVAWSGSAQIRSVTRRTIQLPLGLPPILQPGPVGTGNAAPVLIPMPAGRRLTDRTPPAERQRRIWLFEEEQAARGLPSFQFSLAGRYLLGRGVPRDPDRALELIRKAAAQGYEPAKRVLAEHERLVAERRRHPDQAQPAAPEQAGENDKARCDKPDSAAAEPPDPQSDDDASPAGPPPRQTGPVPKRSPL